MEGSYADFLAHSLEWIRHSGWVGAVWFVVLFSGTSFLFLPASFLTVGAGAIYGFWIAVPLVTAASTLGAAASFLTSRYLARKWIMRKLGQDARMQALEKAVGSEGWKFILISRISPIVPHTFVSYAAGLTQIGFWRFLFASFLGFIPMSAAYSYVGALLGSAVRSSASLTPHDPVTWTLYILGLIATVVVIAWSGVAASRVWKAWVTTRDERKASSTPDDPELPREASARDSTPA